MSIDLNLVRTTPSASSAEESTGTNSLLQSRKKNFLHSTRLDGVFTFVREQHALKVRRSRDRRASFVLETFLLGGEKKNAQKKRTKKFVSL